MNHKGKELLTPLQQQRRRRLSSTRAAASQSPSVLRRFKALTAFPCFKRVSSLIVRRPSASDMEDIFKSDEVLVDFERIILDDEDFFEKMNSSGRATRRKSKELQKEIHDVLDALEEI